MTADVAGNESSAVSSLTLAMKAAGRDHKAGGFLIGSLDCILTVEPTLGEMLEQKCV